jgi:hypothetical protein
MSQILYRSLLYINKEITERKKRERHTQREREKERERERERESREIKRK